MTGPGFDPKLVERQVDWDDGLEQVLSSGTFNNCTASSSCRPRQRRIRAFQKQSSLGKCQTSPRVRTPSRESQCHGFIHQTNIQRSKRMPSRRAEAVPRFCCQRIGLVY